MKKIGIAAALVLTAAAVYLLASRAPTGTSAPEEPLGQAPALSGPALDGKTLSLIDYAGKVVLVDFWATWCEPCREEIPDLVKLHDKLKDKGFLILGVSMDEEGAAAVKKFLAKQPISYPLIVNGSERPPKGWTVPGLPTAYLIGRDGKTIKRWFGEKDMPELEKDVTAALGR